MNTPPESRSLVKSSPHDSGSLPGGETTLSLFRSVPVWVGSLFRNFLVVLLAIPACALVCGIYVYFRLVLRERGPFLYSGPRLGKDKTTFTIYKIRTLRPGVETEIGGELFRPDSDMAIRGGRFLRDTRLDELPQLLNILRGEMDFIGPRPMRQAEYEKVAGLIPHYDRRFRVKPGLTGIAQLITPHKTPKRMRSLIENRYYSTRRSPLEQTKWLCITAFAVMRLICAETFGNFSDRCSTLVKGQRFMDYRRMKRCHCPGSFVRLENGSGALEFPVLEANYSYLACEAVSGQMDPDGPFEFTLRMAGRGKAKLARCRGQVFAFRRDAAADRLILEYEPVSGLNRYLVDQYLLRDSLL